MHRTNGGRCRRAKAGDSESGAKVEAKPEGRESEIELRIVHASARAEDRLEFGFGRVGPHCEL